jgi:hypothetical protein
VKAEIEAWQKALLSDLGPKLKSLGFTKKRGQSFERVTESGRQACHVSFIEHEADFDVTADIAIRFDAVEELLNKGDGLMTKSEKAETFTLGCELGNLTRGEQMRWTVSGPSDIPKVSEAIAAAFESAGMRYFDDLSSMERAFEVLSDDELGQLHMPIDLRRTQSAIVLAYLLDRGDLPAMVERKRKYLLSRDEPRMAVFEDFVGRLM